MENRELLPEDLVAMGCYEETASKVVALLEDLPMLQAYLDKGRMYHCVPLSRVSDRYPLKLRKSLGLDAPGCIWVKGNMDLLNRPAVAVVGSRNLFPANEEFAKKVGELTAQYGLVLISGNARGADMVAQDSCLRAGGSVISVVADDLREKQPSDRILYVSEMGFDLPFTNHRALSRNRLIHSMAQAAFVVQCSNGTGGTWDGTCRNLKGNWSPVYCLSDGSSAVVRLYKLGAHLTNSVNLHDVFNTILSKLGQNDDDS
jgi:DNA processing protein